MRRHKRVLTIVGMPRNSMDCRYVQRFAGNAYYTRIMTTTPRRIPLTRSRSLLATAWEKTYGCNRAGAEPPPHRGHAESFRAVSGNINAAYG